MLRRQAILEAATELSGLRDRVQPRLRFGALLALVNGVVDVAKPTVILPLVVVLRKGSVDGQK
jgi:hypothetical protein